jgi:hypothetical protein
MELNEIMYAGRNEPLSADEITILYDIAISKCNKVNKLFDDIELNIYMMLENDRELLFLG